MKYLEHTMKNGEVWRVPALLIAEARAKYYVGRDLEKGSIQPEDEAEAYENEVGYAMGDDPYDVLDWASNNMNWVDVKEHAIQMPNVKMTEREYQEEWMNGERKVIDVPDTE